MSYQEKYRKYKVKYLKAKFGGASQEEIQNAITTIQQNPDAFTRMSPELRSNRYVVMEAIKYRPQSLYYADDTLKSDREIIMEAVMRNPEMLYHALGEAKRDREVVLTAIRLRPESLYYADDTLKSDREIIMEAVMRNPEILAHIPYDLKNDTDFWDFIIYGYGTTCNIEYFKYVPERVFMQLFDRENFVMNSVMLDGLLLELVSDRLKSSIRVVCTAIINDPNAIQYANPHVFESDENIATILRVLYDNQYEFMTIRDRISDENFSTFTPHQLRTNKIIHLDGIILPPIKLLRMLTSQSKKRIKDYYRRNQAFISELDTENILKNPDSFNIMENYMSIVICDSRRIFSGFISHVIHEYLTEDQRINGVKDDERDELFDKVSEFFKNHPNQTIKDDITRFCLSPEAKSKFDEEIDKYNEGLSNQWW